MLAFSDVKYDLGHVAHHRCRGLRAGCRLGIAASSDRAAPVIVNIVISPALLAA
jgi:hypothetical protein